MGPGEPTATRTVAGMGSEWCGCLGNSGDAEGGATSIGVAELVATGDWRLGGHGRGELEHVCGGSIWVRRRKRSGVGLMGIDRLGQPRQRRWEAPTRDDADWAEHYEVRLGGSFWESDGDIADGGDLGLTPEMRSGGEQKPGGGIDGE
ncbi:hypothetical protein M0R45_016149 [Rubus argutus]|uniref:MHC class I antigen n=1 Tax=Rubus argutus TaxID=59490 RepID=A0AAW1XSM0_RUBAR